LRWEEKKGDGRWEIGNGKEEIREIWGVKGVGDRRKVRDKKGEIPDRSPG